MDYESYQRIVKKNAPPKHSIKNTIYAFISGGFVALLAEAFYQIGMTYLNFTKSDAFFFSSMCVALLSSLLTFVGLYNNIAQKCGAGLFLPTTGFANSVTSSAMEGRSEGLVGGIGSNLFSLAGSVIIYGFLMAFYFATIYYLLNMWGINPWA